MNDESLRYPIGKFIPQDTYTAEELTHAITRIEAIPSKIEASISGFSSEQLDTPYRDGGWTVRQVVHHLADSHMNAYIRVKWTLTEDTPTIKAYDEKAWAETFDATQDTAPSVHLLKALHVKWIALLKGLTPADFKKEFVHPETHKKISLARVVATYAWHGEHHLGHIQKVAKNISIQ